ncbi:MAG: hypothetical protein ACSHYB_03790 [Roseibacillus sp.]
MSTASKQPTLFEVFGRSQSPIVPEINEEALDRLTNVLTSSGDEMGKVVLLRSPRAGYGKTLLLQSTHNRLSESFRFLAVEPSGGGRLDGEVVLESVLRQLSEVLPASGGLTEFDLFARRLFALGLKPLLISGEIPSHDREGALFAIENRPIETFDFHHQQAATAHWTQANFEVLGPRLASELSELSGCGLRGCAYWVDLLFRYATTSPEKVERSRLLSESVFGDLSGQAKSGAEEQLQSLLALLSLIDPVVLVFDETEGLSNQPDAGLRVAAFVVQLRQACPALTVILSVNEDVWQTGLSPLMPGGLEDRLTEFEVRLSELSRIEAESLLTSRFGSDSEAISQKMEWPEPLSARAILREGAEAARSLSVEEFSLEEGSPLAGVVAATPPPLQVASTEAAAETFEEKAERILEPKSSFEAETGVGFEAAPHIEEGTVEAKETVPTISEVQPPTEAPLSASSDDPFGEAPASSMNDEVSTPVAAVQEEAPSPFEIVPEVREPAAMRQAPEPPVDATPSPFEAVDAQVIESVASSEGEWSAESAVEHFEAARSEPTPEFNPSVRHGEEQSVSQPATGSAFDEVAASAQSPLSEQVERSPFQQLEEEKSRLEAELRHKELMAAQLKQQQEERVATELVESSPFSVSEPIQEEPPKFAEPSPAAIQHPVQEAEPSPFSIRPNELEVEKAPEVNPSSVPVQTVVRATTPVVEKVAPPETPTAPPVQEARVAVTREPQAAASNPPEAAAPSPFAATGAPVSSPFASSAAATESAKTEAPSKGQETEDVEELLNQFKKRFGQPDS